MLEYLLVANSVDVIARNSNFYLSKVSRKLLDFMIRYTQVVNEPIHISGSRIQMKCIMKSALLEEFPTKVIVQNIFF